MLTAHWNFGVMLISVEIGKLILCNLIEQQQNPEHDIFQDAD